MKLRNVAIAAAVMMAAASSQAALTDPSADKTLVDAAQSRVIFISGASAVQAGFETLITNMLNGPRYFVNSGAFTAAGQVGVAGTLKAPAGSWNAGDAVIVLYRTTGGSVYGVNSVARNESIAALNVTAAACTGTGTLPGSITNPYTCTTTTRQPDAGVSDVAPALFTSPVNTEGESAAAQLTPDELGVLTSTPLYALAFGIPVTASVPSTVAFNKSIVSSIMTGNISNWSSVPNAGTGDIVICRRTPGSGTQALMNLWAGNYPCSDASQQPADRYAGGNATTGATAWSDNDKKFVVSRGTGGLIVIENGSSGDVRKCLDAANSGGTYTTADRNGTANAVTVDFGTTGGFKAIGVLSGDSMSSSVNTAVVGEAIGGKNAKWQFRSLLGAGKITGDGLSSTVGPVTSGTGVFPTLASLTGGDWDLQAWVSFNVPARTTGNKSDFLTQFVSKAQDPAVLASVTNLKYVAAAVPTSGYTGSQVLAVGYAAGGNQCAPLNRQ